MFHFINQQGRRTIAENFTLAGSFARGLACVKHPDVGVCFIDGTGSIKVQMPRYQQDLTDFHEERARVSQGRLFGFVDIHGNEVVRPAFLWASSFSEGMAPVQLRDGFKYTFLNSDGAVMGNQRFRELRNLNFGLAVAEREGKLFYVNRQMEMTLGPFEDAENFWDGVARVKQDGVYKFIDVSGRTLFENRWDSVFGICLDGRIPFSSEGLNGFLDKAGNVVIPPVFKQVDSFHESIAIVDTAKGKAAIDLDGTVVFETKCDWLGHFSNGLVRYRERGKYGYYDRLGRTAIECKFGWSGDFGDLLAPVSDEPQ